MTINLSLILYKTRIQKKFPLSVFVFIDSLVVSAHKTRVAMRFPVKITSSYIWVAIVYHIFLPTVLRCARARAPLRIIILR